MKKIVIFSSYGGGGQTAVANALSDYLKDDYQVVITNLFSEVLGPLDLSQKISRGRFNVEDIYNYLMSHKHYGLINIYYKLGSWYFKIRQKKVKKNIEIFLEKHKPDLVISVIPMVNDSVLNVTQKLNLPFLLLPTDLDIATFIENIKKPTYKNFKIGLAFEDDEARIRLAESEFAPNTSIVTGFVIRPDFFNAKNKTALKEELGIPQDKPVVLLLLGAVGSQSLYDFSKELSKITVPAHIIICTSLQEKVKKKIDELVFPPYLTKTTIGFTQRISDLMAISDLFITKSGSVSVCEAIYMNLPMMLDATTNLLAWEQANHRFIKRHNLGTIIKTKENLSETITALLQDQKKCHKYKQRLINFEKKHGGIEIKNLITSMITQHTS